MNIETLMYVIHAPYFWLSMGMVTAIAIFVGAIIYDGDLPTASKGLISVGLYAIMLFQVSFTRIGNFFINHPEKIDMTRYAGVMSIFFVTLFWIFGVFIGVFTSFLVHKGKLHL